MRLEEEGGKPAKTPYLFQFLIGAIGRVGQSEMMQPGDAFQFLIGAIGSAHKEQAKK